MLTRYNGGKNQAGLWQRIISLLPPHEIYIEPFLGSGAILRRKRPAALNVGLDADPAVIASSGHFLADPSFRIIHGDALAWLARAPLDSSCLIYCDPPYLLETRSSQRALYHHEFSSPEDHAHLLALLLQSSARVIISGYDSPLYADTLSSWQRRSWTVTKRSGKPALECVWFNYAEPTTLHDFRFIGRDFHDRARVHRKLNRWRRRLAALPALERNALLAALQS